MAEFSHRYTPFATRGLVILVLPFNKYLLKLFSRNTLISHFLKKKLVDKEALGQVSLWVISVLPCQYHSTNGAYTTSAIFASFLKLRVSIYTMTKFLPHFSSSRCFANMTCDSGHPSSASWLRRRRSDPLGPSNIMSTTEIISNNKANLQYRDHALIFFCEIFSNAISINTI